MTAMRPWRPAVCNRLLPCTTMHLSRRALCLRSRKSPPIRHRPIRRSLDSLCSSRSIRRSLCISLEFVQNNHLCHYYYPLCFFQCTLKRPSVALAYCLTYCCCYVVGSDPAHIHTLSTCTVSTRPKPNCLRPPSGACMLWRPIGGKTSAMLNLFEDCARRMS